MKIYLATFETFSDEAAYRHYRINTQRAIPIELMDWEAEGYADFTETPYDPATHKQDGVENVNGWRRKIVEKSAEEIKSETYVHQITPRQCRLYLAGQGVLAAVEQAIAGMGDAAKIEWEYALEIKRDHALVLGLAAMLNYDEDALHQMFWEASKL